MADNIDFATFDTDALNLGHYASATVSVGNSLTASFIRVGNIVIVNMSSVTSTAIATQYSTALSETCPSGFRPIEGTRGIFLGRISDGGDLGSAFYWRVTPTGVIAFSCTGATTSGAKRVDANGCWYTADEFPS